MNVAVLTVSDRAARGEYADEGGPLVVQMMRDAGAEVTSTGLVPDERSQIEAVLIEWSGTVDVILTTGGTGLGPRDVTPEATRAVIEREAPGIAEATRAAGLSHTPFAALSRQVCGTRDNTLILNLPGAPKAAAECLAGVIDLLAHAVEMMKQ